MEAPLQASPSALPPLAVPLPSPHHSQETPVVHKHLEDSGEAVCSSGLQNLQGRAGTVISNPEAAAGTETGSKVNHAQILATGFSRGQRGLGEGAGGGRQGGRGRDRVENPLSHIHRQVLLPALLLWQPLLCALHL